MTKMNFTLYGSNCVQNQKNCRYPFEMKIRSPADLCRAASRDFVCAKFRDNYRSNGNFMCADAAFWDVDNSGEDDPEKWITPEMIGLYFPDVAYAITPSRHNQIPKKDESARPRFHILSPIHEITSCEQYRDLKARVQQRFPFFDENAVDAARFVYGCRVREEEIIWHEGTITIDDFIKQQGAAFNFNGHSDSKSFGCEPSGFRIFNSGVLRSAADEYVIPEGTRNATLSRYAGRVILRFGEGERARSLFLKEAARCRPPLPDTELSAIWRSACGFGKKVAESPDYVPPDRYDLAMFQDLGPQSDEKRAGADIRIYEPKHMGGRKEQDSGGGGSDDGSSDRLSRPPAGSLKPEDYTDLGQARVLTREYGEELRYSPALDYMRYDGVQWQESGELAIGAEVELTDLQMADADLLLFQTKKALNDSGITAEEAAEATKKRKKGMKTDFSDMQMKLYDDYLDAKTYQSFVIDRRNWKYLKAAVNTCKPLVQIDIHDFDRNEFLLNTPSWTYDLRKGIDGKREHRPGDFITKCTAVDPGDEGRELWEDALNRIFLGDQELIEYVKRVVGLAAIGKVYVEALIISYGGGRNGKSTFWNTVMHVLGSYSGRLSADTLTVGCRRNIKPELAEVFGKRLIIAAELEEGQRLNTSIIKQLCSTDDIFAEKKYKAPFFFTPTHTVILYTNHLPRVGATDDGIWRRLIVIPFKAKFEGKSDMKNFASVLQEKAGPAVLSWIIEGARKVIESGYIVQEPELVRSSISDYREQNDWMAQFLSECCEVVDDPNVEVKSGELFQRYREYTLQRGEYSRGSADFYAELENKGFVRHRTNQGKFFRKLRLRDEDSGFV